MIFFTFYQNLETIYNVLSFKAKLYCRIYSKYNKNKENGNDLLLLIFY